MLPEELQKGMKFNSPTQNVSVRNPDNFKWGENEIIITNIRRTGETPDEYIVYYKDSGNNRYKSDARWFCDQFGDFRKNSNIKKAIFLLRNKEK